MKTHEIRLNIEFCDDVISGKKNFEIRTNDRGYQTGDLIKFTAVDSTRMPENHPINDKLYSIEYVLNGWGLKNGYVALAIRDIETEPLTAELFKETLKTAKKTAQKNNQLSDKHWEECRQIALYDDQLRKAVELLKRVRDVHAAAIREGSQSVSVLTGRLMNEVDELFEEIERTENKPVRICDYTAAPCCYPDDTCALCPEKHGSAAYEEE